MERNALLIRNIAQKDNHTFTIEWSNGKAMDYRLSDLQKQCPCAACVDEATGKRTLDTSIVHSDVRAIRIESVGRYALRIQFTSGCSSGIYDFDLLHKISS